MSCPVCSERKARRDCPALHKSICTVCCATKRLVDIDCPPGCAHLAASRAHPSSALKRQQDADVAQLLPSIKDLTERQYQLYFLFQNVIAQTQPEGLARVVDADVVEASSAVASTLETAAKGVIYEQQPQSAVARRMAEAFRAMLAQAREQGATFYDREAAITLRAIAEGAGTIAGRLGTGDAGYIELMARLLQVNRAKPAGASGGGLILP